MHQCNAVNANAFPDAANHIDATSEHAKRDMQQYANGYATVRQFLGYSNSTTGPLKKRMGYRDWLARLGPLMTIQDATGTDYSLTVYRRYVANKKASHDPWGRARKRIAHKGILNPSNRIQFVFWYLSYHDPQRCQKMMVAVMRYIRRWLHKTYGNVPVQVAYHVRTGRVHWEWTAPNYNRKGAKTSPEVPWDSSTASVKHVNRFFRDPSQLPKDARINSILEIQLSLHIIRHLSRLCLFKRVPKPTQADLEKAKQFFTDLQLSSLLDGAQSRCPRRRNAAEALLVKKRLMKAELAQERLRKYRAELARRTI